MQDQFFSTFIMAYLLAEGLSSRVGNQPGSDKPEPALICSVYLPISSHLSWAPLLRITALYYPHSKKCEGKAVKFHAYKNKKN